MIDTQYGTNLPEVFSSQAPEVKKFPFNSPDPLASINLVTSLVINHHLPFTEVSTMYYNPVTPISRPSHTTSGITQPFSTAFCSLTRVAR